MPSGGMADQPVNKKDLMHERSESLLIKRGIQQFLNAITIHFYIYLPGKIEVQQQRFRSGGQSDEKTSFLVPKQAWYSFYRPTERMKGRVDLVRPRL
ncbi:hypothetical protein TNCV_2895461 [Trichonephila clavipes]|nr:hypothetical protein TNCV_2895461 [Trichonephila clavipes]